MKQKGGPALFERVDKKTVSNAVIEQVMEMVRNGKLGPGDQLPTEHKLSQVLGVGRSSVREALKALEVLRIIRRDNEGSFVSEEYPLDALSQLLGTDLLLHQLDAKHVYQARRILELELGAIAAGRVTSQDLAKLDDLCARMEGTPVGEIDQYVALDRKFHTRISEIAGNPVLQRMWEIAYSMFLGLRQRAGLSREDLTISNERHRKLVHALAQRDPQAVRSTIEATLQIGERSLVQAIEHGTRQE